MAALNTETQTMTTAANHVVDVAAQVHQEMNALQMRLGALDSTWRGAAKVAFDELMIRWQDSGRQLNEALNAIAETLRTNSTAYEAAQEDHVAALRTLNI